MSKDKIVKCVDMLQAGQFEDALQTIATALLDSPKDEDWRKVAFMALDMGWLKVPQELIELPMFAEFFCQCDQCGAYWISSAAAFSNSLGANFAGANVSRPAGVYCDSCGGTFCRNCYVLESDSTITCPKCSSKDARAPLKPNGRKNHKQATATAKEISEKRKKCPNCANEFFLTSDTLQELTGIEIAICLKEGFDPSKRKKTTCPACGQKSLTEV